MQTTNKRRPTDGLFEYIHSMGLDPTAMRRLGTRLIEVADREEPKRNYPKIPRNREVSKKTLDMVIGPMPKNFDWELETGKMWEEMAL